MAVEIRGEVFPNPVVTQVIFQIRFPNLFFIEQKIGDFQLHIMRDFPESSLVVQQQYVYAQAAPEDVEKMIARTEVDRPVKKIWKFTSKDGVVLEVQQSVLTLVSTKHKTYQTGTTNRFRDVIETCVGSFLKLVEIPIINRIGLRYVDVCPVPERTTKSFREHFDTAFPLERFPVEEATEMGFNTVVNREDCQLRYKEMLRLSDGKTSLLLDFDAWSEQIASERIVVTTDNLHSVIRREFEKSIKEPVLQFMRTPQEAGP